MSDVPEMPADWWPDEIVVVGRFDGCELGFLIQQRDMGEGMIEAQIRPCLDGLRASLWQEKHKPVPQSFRDIKDEINGAPV